MRHDTHISIGVLGYTVVAKSGLFSLGEWFVAVAFLPVVAIFSTLPDTIERPLYLRHRGPTHSALVFVCIIIVAALSMYGRLWGIGTFLFLAVTVGYGLHILADSFTDNGVCLFWPLHKKRIKPGKYRLWYYKQGKGRESIVTLVAGLSALVIWTYPALKVLWEIFTG